MKNVIARIGVFGKNEHPVDHYTTKLDLWLRGKTLEFEPVKYAKFGKGMTMATVEFDKDHCIYILLPEDVFVGENPFLPKEYKKRIEKL